MTIRSGGLDIIFTDESEEINPPNIAPGWSATKIFTVYNPKPEEYTYKILFTDVNNTLVNKEDLVYTITSTGGGIKDETEVPVVETTVITNIKIASKVTHTYTLTVAYKNADHDQMADMGKTFNFKIKIAAANICEIETCQDLQDAILAQGGGAAAISGKTSPNFSNIATAGNTGLYATTDDYGTSYYYRGLKANLNNNLIFAGFQWKIVRINGNGSIRLIYNGLCPNDSCSINSTGISTQIEETYTWNPDPYHKDPKYVGYMYGGLAGADATCKDGIGCATANETSSNARTQLELWYANNIVTQGQIITSKIMDTLFCNDRTVTYGLGYGKSETQYGALDRLYQNNKPTLKCSQKNDRFTVSDDSIGNSTLIYPVGLITADEAVMAGLVLLTENKNNYLYTNQIYWLFSPFSFSHGTASMWDVYSNGGITTSSVEKTNGLRPAISIKSTTIIGTGSTTNPFKVVN